MDERVKATTDLGGAGGRGWTLPGSHDPDPGAASVHRSLPWALDPGKDSGWLPLGPPVVKEAPSCEQDTGIRPGSGRWGARRTPGPDS